MDHGRKMNKIETPLTSKRPKLPLITVTDSSFVKDKPTVEDHRLVNWKRWLKRHQKQYKALGDGRSRNKTEIAMNSSDKIRPKIEMRNLIECATIAASSVTENGRGNPGFWKVPPFLPNRGTACSSQVGPVLTKIERNLLPTLEYVDIPMCIRTEKNLANTSQKVPNWERSFYLKKRKQELTDAIAMLQPSTPEAVNLIVRGHAICPKEENVTHVPVISITDTSLQNEDSQVKIREFPIGSDVVVALKINDIEITRDEQSIYESSETDTEEITWTLDFSGKTNQKSKQYLYFENVGTVAITYQWRNSTFSSDISSLLSRNSTSFFFNKNKALILPGQKFHFPVWFQKRQAGIFSECWRMETSPIVSRAVFIIRMRGYAASEELYTSKLAVDVYLNRCIRNTAVRETIDDVIRNVRPSRYPEPAYKTLYLEGNLFRAKNPSHFYQTRLIAQLYRLYTITSAPDVSTWSLSLVDLRNLLLHIKNPEVRHARLQEFSDLCQQCLVKICFSNPARNTKYAMVYNVLCAFANEMEEESEFVKRNCVLRNENVFSSCRDIPPKDSIAQTPEDTKLLPTTLDRTEIAPYREVFYVRIYELLVEAVEQACAIIESLNNLNQRES